MSSQYIRFPNSSAGSANPSVGPNGDPTPSESTLVGGENPSGDLEPLQTDSSGNLLVNVNAGSITAENPSVSPTGSTVPADATYLGVNRSGNLVGVTEGQATMAQSLPIAIASDQSAVPISAVSLPLPTGAATSANQTNASQKTQLVDGSGNVIASTSNALNVQVENFPATQPISGTVTANQGSANATPWNENIAQFGGSAVVTGTGVGGSGIPRMTVSNDSKIIAWDGTNTSTIKAASTAPSATDTAIVVAISPNTPAIATSSPINANGSSATTTVSTVTTITKPANAVGFFLQCDAASTDYIRWCDSNGTASATVGFVLQPGQDTGFVPMAHNLSVCAHASTQTYNIQWVLSS